MDLQIFAASVGTRLCNGDELGKAIRDAAVLHEYECDAVTKQSDGVLSQTRAGEFEVVPVPKGQAMSVLFEVQPSCNDKPALGDDDKSATLAMLSEYMDRQDTWRVRLAERVYDLIAGRG